MSPGSSTESYPAFAHIGWRENPGKNLNQVTCPDRESNPGHLVSRPDALAVTLQVSTVAADVSKRSMPVSHSVRKQLKLRFFVRGRLLEAAFKFMDTVRHENELRSHSVFNP
ncbi:hypothetical protein ANN_23500 [Periplaneta americana]|uniref:Uncharacterized protein n=1 Tax=Periplaneta americana TaxID=6978 RepID=A0ABQ8SM69_PERAM|nr:hypothetical protein ANN_23500 [Periplaneta americana]